MDDGWFHDPGSIREWNSYIEGTVDDGFLENNRGNYPNPKTSTRLCGVDRRSARTLRLYFNKASLNISDIVISTYLKGVDVSDASTVSDASLLFRGPIGSSDGSIRASSEFGREDQLVYYYDITTEKDIPVNRENIKILHYNTDDNSIQGEVNVTLSAGNDGKMRDSLLNDLSGSFDVLVSVANQFYSGDIDAPLDSTVELRAHYDANIKALLENVTIIFGDPSTTPPPTIPTDPATQPMPGSSPSPTMDGPTFSVVNERVIMKDYPIFTANTRLRFDWSSRTLFIIRDDEEALYLAYTEDKETGVAGWTRGKLGLRDAVFLDSLPYNPPEQLPVLLGLKGTNILALPKPLASKEDAYVEDLPNCLDEHVVIGRNGSDPLNMQGVKASLISMGYKETDIITIARQTGTTAEYTKIPLDDLSSPENFSVESIIIGKPFTSRIVGYHPLVQTRMGWLLGNIFRTAWIVFNSIFNTAGRINKCDIPNKTNAHAKRDVYGTEFLKYGVDSAMDYDSLLEIEVDSPYPFSIGGYIQVTSDK